MPVRSSICTYSPASVSNNSKYSTASSLSIGHYKPLTTSGSLTNKSYGSGTGTATLNRYSTSSYSPSSLNSSTYSSNSSPSSYSPSTGSYRPLSSTHSSLGSGRYGANSLLPTSLSSTAGYSRYSTGSASSSSISSANSLLASDRSDLSSAGYSSSCSRRYQPSIRLLRRSSSEASQPSTQICADSQSTAGRQKQSIKCFDQDFGYDADDDVMSTCKARVPKGLVNLGNTCYMNSVLQSLYSIDSFRKFILQAPHNKMLASEVADLFKSMKNSSASVYPSNFKYAFSRHQSRFSGSNQHDAQEFLRYLIIGIHEEFNLASSRPRRSTNLKPPKTADEAWSQYKEIVDDSPLVDILVGQLCSTVICGVCHNKSHCWDPFWDLSLPLVRGRQTCRLSDVVEDFVAKETLDADERPNCSNCKRATKSTKQIAICRLPQLIILHLKKFSNDGYKLTSPDIKIDRMLTFNGTTYNLVACISHHGYSSSSGHYTCHCEYGSRWFHFNDER